MQKGGIIPLCHYLVCYCVNLFRFWYSVEWVKVKYMEYTVEGENSFRWPQRMTWFGIHFTTYCVKQICQNPSTVELLNQKLKWTVLKICKSKLISSVVWEDFVIHIYWWWQPSQFGKKTDSKKMPSYMKIMTAKHQLWWQKYAVMY